MDSVGKIKANIVKSLPFLVFVLGVFLRIIYFGEIPGGFHRDEAYGAWNALSLYKDGIDSAGHSYPVYFEAWAHGQNALNSYLMLPFIFLNGGHISTVIVRIPQVILAVITLVAVYYMMKRMYSRQIAVWAMFLLAICPWHVMMSRWGLESNLAPGFLILGLCFWIYGLEKHHFLLLSAFCYGMSLYCYATIWPIVPVMILLQTIYSWYAGKIKINKWLFGFYGILAALGLPLVLFMLVNMGIFPEIKIGCFSIYRMTAFRTGELATGIDDILRNIRNTLYLLKNQDVGRPYDVIMPYGFFYDIGRVFILIGAVVVVVRGCISIINKKFSYDIFLIIQLIGAGIVGSLIYVSMTQINCLYIPLVLCGAIGVIFVGKCVARLVTYFLKERLAKYIASIFYMVICIVFVVNMVSFQSAYYGDYKELVSAHFQEGADEAVRYAQKVAGEKGFSVSVNEGLKYPNVLLATETGAREYLDTLVYSENLPAPKQFDCDEVTFYMGIDYSNICKDMVYVLYFTDLEMFEGFNFVKFFDWYVAIPE